MPCQLLTGKLCLVAPFLLWMYMLMAQIGMLNLLIAVMTDTYFKVGDTDGSASASWRMSRVATNVEYIQRASVPAPLDLPILLSRPEETLPLLPPPRVEQRINLHRLRARPGG